MLCSKLAIFRKSVELSGVDKVVNFLQEDGYSVIGKNFYTRYGELDLIAKKEDTICFIEVKTRSKARFPICNTVDFSKQKKLSLAAQIFCSKIENKQNHNFRFDVATVDLSKNDDNQLNYVPNAFYCQV